MYWPTRQLTTALGIAAWIALAAQADCQESNRAGLFSLVQRQSESKQVEEYLKSLLLEELVIEHLEIETSRETNRVARRDMAARLINEYAQRMMSGRDSDGSDWQSKAELLLKTYPELTTTSIRIAILQSRYLRSEKAFRNWWDSGQVEKLKPELVRLWLELNSELETLKRKLDSNYEDQVAALQSNPEQRDVESRRLAQLEGWLLHTDYLIGWSSYFLGVLIPDQRREFMLNSDIHFREFLQIEPKKTLSEVSPEWFDFSSDWNARAVVGLAMCQRGLNHPEQSQYCFELLGSHASNQQTRDLRFVWELNSRIYLNEVIAAQEFVDSMGEARHLSESGRTAFWLATLKASVATRNHEAVTSQRLLRTGLTGLARQFDAPRILKFLDENRMKIGGEDFLSLWIAGYMDFHEAKTLNLPEKHEQAKLKLTAALVSADESTDPNDLARCRFLVASIEMHDREYERAAKTFVEVSSSLAEVAPEISAESQWLAVRSLSELSRENPRVLIQANRAIDQLLRRFPGSSFAKRAEFEKMRVQISNLPPDVAIERLNRIPTNDANYVLAANEIVKIRFGSWLDAHQAKSASEPRCLQALLDAESEFGKLSAASRESKLKSELLVVDAMLRTATISNEAIEKRLTQIKNRIEDSERSGPVYQEFRYYQFLLANRTGDQAAARDQAQWLSENAKGTQFEKSAMIQFAQLADSRLRNNAIPSPDEIAEVTTIFTKLVSLLGATATELKESPNARVAFARLAELKLISGSPEEAIEMLVFLDSNFPNHKSYLRQLASTYTRSQRYADAILIWQKLVRGVDPGSDLWFESKYNLALCLFHSGQRDAARQLHEQTRRLSPDVPETWIKPFEELSDLLTAKGA